MSCCPRFARICCAGWVGVTPRGRRIRRRRPRRNWSRCGGFMRGALRRSIEWDEPKGLVRGDGLVDVFFLRGVKADQGLDRLDQPLCVANEIAVDIFRRQLLRDAGEQPGEMQYLT